MRTSLADSLIYVQSCVGRELSVSDSEVAEVAEKITRTRVHPGVFGRYYKIILAIESERFEDAAKLFRDIASIVHSAATFSVAPFSASRLGDDEGIYRDLLDPHLASLPWICPPAPDIQFEDNVHRSFDLVHQADEQLGQELRGLITQVVGASPSHGTGAQSFGSASSMMLWGLVVFNVERYRTAIDLISALVHEAAHLLLFAHSIEGPLVTNPIDQRFTSPLRRDPRPMDGVFHATFVAARMHYANEKLRRSGALDLDASRVSEFANRAVELRELYSGGLETVEKYGMLTLTGQRIIDETREYMKAA